MARLIKKDRGNYTNTSNKLIRDDRLTWKARGIFNYLWSQANEWQFYVSEIVKHSPGGIKELRNGLDELEKFGYLKRTNRHGANGNFSGMDWILDDEGTLIDENCHSDHFGEDAEMELKEQKVFPKASDAKDVGRENGSTLNGTLRNNNNKNYQYKELSINKSSSSSLEIDDEDGLNSNDQIINQRVSDLLTPIRDFAKISNQIIQPTLRELKQIRLQVSKLSDFGFEQLNRDFKDKISAGLVDNPIGYLLVMLKNEIESERFWTQPH